jgi:dihydroorotate dehydrogenase
MSKFYEKVIRPMLFSLSAETAHELGIEALKLGLGAKVDASALPRFGEIERFGLKFHNPLGIAAGFDKNGAVVNQLAALGFGFIEVGTVTHKPQKGNEKPRLFRLPEDQALINRLGFNNDGAKKIVERLGRLDRKCTVGVNIGKNKDVPNEKAIENYLSCLDLIHPVADYIAVNVSSPNTPSLRELQQADSLEALLTALQNRNAELGRKPLLVKIAPDLSEAEIEAITDACLRLKIEGIIATNTTISRKNLKLVDPEKFGSGGLSGKPLTARSNEVISKIFTFSKGRLPIIGVGGVFTAKDAFDKIAAGASLVQAYTGFIYGGMAFPKDLLNGLAEILNEKGFESLEEAVGSQTRYGSCNG